MAESIIKGKRKGFTMIYNSVLKDTRLDLKTKGFFAVMMSFPDEWEFSINGLCKVMGTKDKPLGRDTVKRCLDLLATTGYLIKEQTRGAHGEFAVNSYVLMEESTLPADISACPPSTGFPSTAPPATENCANKYYDNKNYNNIPPIVPQEGTAQKPKRTRNAHKETADHQPERFEKFWAAYPRHESRQRAIAAWDRLKANDALLHQMSAALAVQLKSPDWLKGIGIPYAATWLNGERWKDVPFVPPQSGPEPGTGRQWADDPEVIPDGS